MCTQIKQVYQMAACAVDCGGGGGGSMVVNDNGRRKEGEER